MHTEMSVTPGTGDVTVHLVSRRDDLHAAIALVGEMLRAPTFPPEALDEVKRQALAGIEQQRKEPRAVAQNTVERVGNPYPRGDVRHARTFDEILADVNAVTIDKVRDFHGRF